MSDFSVLMPVYFKEDPARFAAALASVFSNTLYPPETLVVCDGLLTEALEDVLSQYKNYRGFRILRLEKNQGIVAALNYGLRAVSNGIVVRCDSDDINYPERFEKLLAKLAQGYDVVGSQVVEVASDGSETVFKQLPLDHEDIVSFARKRNPLNHMSVAYRVSDVLAIGGYPAIYLKEDYALWAKLIASGKRFANLNEVLVSASAGIEMYSRRGGLRAAFSEYKLQLTLLEAGITTPSRSVLNGFGRFVIFLGPKKMRALVYREFLRKVFR